MCSWNMARRGINWQRYEEMCIISKCSLSLSFQMQNPTSRMENDMDDNYDCNGNNKPCNSYKDLTLTLPGPAAGVGGSLTVTVA